MNNEQFKAVLQKRLSEKRYIHSLNVADSAKELAIIYGCDPEKAYTVGLIHDCCKDEPAGLQLSYMLENKVELSEYELDVAKKWLLKLKKNLKAYDSDSPKNFLISLKYPNRLERARAVLKSSLMQALNSSSIFFAAASSSAVAGKFNAYTVCSFNKKERKTCLLRSFLFYFKKTYYR